MRSITWQGIAAGIVLGIVFAPYIRKLPLVSSLPTA